ncbi:sensor histidine kinase [Paenibacillus roseipurpureus]|uniref:histidine kinase n=1 Tax=Paenibacillus roseopurpureus TaxID=2918901 RepID=A0AA96RK13_9BACL|nr:histidine kinase [Paenibacillus sp. MBLB1832]WNR44360.1 histidine kinase [Paenibacillus sp. MBLB1832]
MKKVSYIAFHSMVFVGAICFLMFVYGLLQLSQPSKPADLIAINSDQVSYQWSIETPAETQWRSSPEKPGSLAQQQRLWMKINVPDKSWKAPELVIYPSVPELTVHRAGATEVHAANRHAEDARFVIEWSSIPLGNEDLGHTVLFSVDRPGALPYAFEIGERASMVEYFFENDLKLIIGFMIMVFIGLVAIGLFMVYPKERLYLIFSLFAWSLSLLFLVRMNAKHLFYFSPELYYYLSLVGAIGWPLFSLLFLEKIVHPAYKLFIRRLWQGYALLCFIVVTIMTLRPDTYRLFEEGIMAMIVQLIWLSVVVVLILSIRRNPANMEYAFFLFGYTVNFLDLAYSIAFSYQNGGIASSSALALAFTAIMARRYWLMQKEIVALNTSLERKVHERTEELEQTHKRLVHSIRESSVVMSEMSALEERNRIAQQMHDVVGHTLTTSIVQLEAGKLFMNKDIVKAKQMIATAEELVRKGLDDIRGSVRMLKDEDWSERIAVLLRRVLHETEVLVDVDIIDQIEDGLNLIPLHKNLIYFALIEGLTNGIRHGKSKRFTVSLRQSHNGWTFLLASEGIPYEGQPYGFGLETMREKTLLLGGKMDFRANMPVKGAVLEIQMPIA